MCASGQSAPKFMGLIPYLKIVETNHNVVFSYENDNLKFVVVQKHEHLKSLEDHLQYLRDFTVFDYVLQTENNILVIPISDSKNVCLNLANQITTEPVANAIVKYKNFSFRSDTEGRVDLPLFSEMENVRVHAEDFISQEYTVDVHQPDCFDLFMSPFYQALDEVFLTNFLTRGIQKIASGEIEINYEEFGLLPGLVEPDVLQTLQALPGIISRRESVSYLNVRGGTHDQNLFLWDGIKMYSTSHFFGMISAFNPYLTQTVKLVKNGTSAKFGDGVSSLIDMKTSRAIAGNLKASVGVNFINADALVEVPLSPKSSVEFSSRHSVNSIWESPTYNQYFDKVFQNTEVTNFETPTSQQNNDFSFFDATINYKLKLSDQDFFRLNLIYAEDDFNLDRFDAENELINTRTSDLAKTNLAGGIFYERAWTDKTKSQIQFYTSQYTLDAENTNLLNQQSLEQKNKIDEIAFKLNFQTRLMPNLGLESGYQFNETGILNSQRINDPDFFSQTQNAILTHSLYAQLNYQSDSKRLNLNLGGRLNHYSKFDKFIAEPRFNMSYQFIKDLFFEVLAEQKSQVTSQTVDLQTDFLGVENRRWVLSDPSIRPIIESQQISAGLNFVKPKWFFNLDFYYKEVEGITTQGQNFQNQFQFSQTHGRYNVRGFDVLINKNFDPFSGWVSYSLSENNYKFDELMPSSFHNNLDIRHVISTGLSYENKGLKISSGFNWHSGATTTLISEVQQNLPQSIQYEAPNSARLKDYFRLDISSTYTFNIFKNIKAMAGLSLLNVLDTRNIYNQFYLIDQGENIQNFRQNGLGFTPNMMLRLAF